MVWSFFTMYKPYKRKKNRSKAKVKGDINDTQKIVREDIYDLIKETKTKAEAEETLISFFDGLNQNVKTEYKGIENIKARVLSDLDSYGIEWEDE